MRTKFFLLFVLILGLTLNGFSQEKTIYKQTIYKGTRDNNRYTTIKINATCDIVISFGQGNAIFFSQENYDKDNFQSFVVVDEDKLIINQPSIQGDKPFAIRLQLERTPYQIILGKDAKVYFNDIFDSPYFECFLKENSMFSFLRSTKIDNLIVSLEKDSKISFDNITSRNVYLQGPFGTEAKFESGNIENLTTDKGDGVNVIGNCKIVSIKENAKLPTAIKAIGNIDIANYDGNVENIDSKFKIENSDKKCKSGVSFDAQFSFGGLGWNSPIRTVDDLFSSPEGVYDLKYGFSWNMALKANFTLSKKWNILIGLGYESNIFYFQNNLMLMENGANKQITFNNDATIDAESKLVARYVTIPLTASYKIYKDFSIYFGGILGINFRTNSTGFKRDYPIINAEVEERWGEKYNNFKPIKAEVQVGLGWEWINIYAKYALTPIFKTGKETTLYPYSFGLSLGI
jgi:hypothetical protein